METITIQPVQRPVRGSIRPPGSKSITNRAIVCAALGRGQTVLTGALDSEDTQVMLRAVRALGISLEHDKTTRRIRIAGCGGKLPVNQADLYCANSGTTMRFLTCLVALGQGVFRLSGVPRMHERPIEDLLAALRQLGVDVASEAGNGCPPVVVRANGLPGGEAQIAGDISSQFLSGLLMAAPYAKSTLSLRVMGELVSQPYVRMTEQVMAQFGVPIRQRDWGLVPQEKTVARDEPESSETFQYFSIRAPQHYDRRGLEYAIEPDASAASYFMAVAAITGGRVTIEGLSRQSLQGDTAFADCLEKMGCTVQWASDSVTVRAPEKREDLRGIEINMNPISDTVQTLSAVALFAQGSTTITGIGHIRHKETDRIHALAVELRKFGAEVLEWPEGLKIVPRPLSGAEIDTYDDHRMAMSMALVGLRVPGVVIRNPGCTRKTYPAFFEDLDRLVGD